MDFISVNFMADPVSITEILLILFSFVCNEAPLNLLWNNFFVTSGTMNFLFVVLMGILFKHNVAFSEFES